MQKIVLKPKPVQTISEARFTSETMQSEANNRSTCKPTMEVSTSSSTVNSGNNSQHSHKDSLLRKAKDWFKLNNATSKTYPKSSSLNHHDHDNKKIKNTEKEVVILPVITPPPEEWFACKECCCIVSSAILCPASCKAGTMVPIHTILRASVFYGSQKFNADSVKLEIYSEDFSHAAKPIK